MVTVSTMPGALLSLLLLGPTEAAAQSAGCEAEDMDRLRAAAQSLAPETEALASRLARCQSLRDEALLWRAYYQQFRGDYRGGAQSARAVAGSTSLTERLRVLGSATEGHYAALERKVDEQAPGHAGDAESLLVLARALARARRFDDADRRYREYLRLKPDDLDVHAERAFALYWAEDVYGALEAFDELLGRPDLDERRRRQFLEGRSLVSARVRELHEREPFVPNSFTGGPEWAWASYRGFTRSSLSTGWLRQELALSVAVHRLDSRDGTRTGYEAAVAHTFELPLGFALYGRGGFLYAEEGVPLGTLVLARPFAEGVVPLVGMEQEAVVRTAGLPRDLAGMTRRTLFAGARYQRLLEYRFTRGVVSGAGAYRKHVGLLRVPVFESARGRAFASALLRVENEGHDQLSRYLYSPKNATLVRPGLGLSGSPAARTHARLEAGFGLLREQRLPARAGEESLSLGASASALALAGEIWTELSCRFAGVFSLRGDWTFGEGRRVTYGAGALFAGLALYQDRCDGRGGRP